jgi:inosose dehydratase
VELEPERVLREMRELGLRATEFGPLGYLGADAQAVVALLERHGIELVGGFLPVVLHDGALLDESLALARRTAELYAACGGRFVVSAVVLDQEWSPPRELADAEWRQLLDGLARLDEVAAAHGLAHVFHPHVGTLVETAAQVERVLDGCDVRLCLDTGHLTIGGADPVALVRDVPGRIAHVHLKDVRGDVARRLRDGDLSLVEAVQQGLFRPLGEGDVRVADVVRSLERTGYEGWLVLEQDAALGTEPPDGTGPLDDVRRSVEFLRSAIGEQRKEGTDDRA